jgi:hypothetical protein
MRLFIKPEMPRGEVLGLLDKMREWISRSEEWPMFMHDDAAAKEHSALEIHHSTTAIHDLCAICGDRTNSECGSELFMAGTESPVCYECGAKYEPSLVQVLLAYQQARTECGTGQAECYMQF